MDDTSRLPARSKSKRTRSSHTLRESSRKDHNPKTLTATTRPHLTERTSSAPLVPVSRDKGPDLMTTGNETDRYKHRDSVASISEDPFLRNYRTPNSVSLARELRSATYSEHSHDGGASKDLLSRSNQRPAADGSVNLPVSYITPRYFLKTKMIL
jgi:hypothetical protein